MIHLRISQQDLYRLLLDNKHLSTLNFDIFVAFAIHINAWSLAGCRHMLFGKLVVMKDLGLLGTILVDKGNLNATRLVCFWLLLILALKDRFFGSQAKFLKPKLDIRRWLMQSKIH